MLTPWFIQIDYFFQISEQYKTYGYGWLYMFSKFVFYIFSDKFYHEYIATVLLLFSSSFSSSSKERVLSVHAQKSNHKCLKVNKCVTV